ncbi:hypothetical protein [Maliponia aquimaris]|uniref:Uncharacterized protein n=1 Tax=Maliponia aquimaris TaxID=1673631 RepID=A0A238K7L3_9RHOB|nr:hypothetical protein [Maliponia aquimaris]SMX38878.1 hypothetical protein MAA8898_01765 [Maliponia aquimaris]
MPDTGLAPTHEPIEGTNLSDICTRLRLAASILERSAYDLANLHACPDVTHLILSAQTVERITERLCKQVCPD